MNRTTASTPVLAAIALSMLALSGCASGGSSGGSTPAGPASTAASSPSTASSAPASSPASSGGSTPDATTKAAGGACTLIDESTAVAILGSPVKATAAQDIGTTSGDDGSATKLDGCLYKGTTGSIGYDVVKFDGVDSATLFAAAKGRASAELKSGKAKEFATSVPDALGYTLTLPLGTDSILTTVKSGWMVTVSVSVKSPDPADSAGKVNAAAQALLGSI
ncbi:MAG: hypothetical protein U0R76_13170 [Candidatus Nanopelagicales bacterium]